MVLARTLRATLLALFLLSLSQLHAFAEGGATFGLRPERYDPARPLTRSYFIYEATQGQSFRDEIRVWNSGESEGTMRLYAVDATTGQTSGAVYQAQDSQRSGVGSWIQLEQSEITLAPGEERVIGFTVHIPAGARAGQHLGGLVAEDMLLHEGQQQGNLQIKMQTRTVAAVQVNLPGERFERVEIVDVKSDIESDLQALILTLRNTGTEMTKPTGSLAILDAQNREVGRIPFQMDTFLPGSEIDYPLYVQGEILSEGQYRVVPMLTYGNGGEARYEKIVEVTPAQIEQIYESVKQELPERALAPAPTSLIETLEPWIPLIGAGLLFLLLAFYLWRLVPQATPEDYY